MSRALKKLQDYNQNGAKLRMVNAREERALQRMLKACADEENATIGYDLFSKKTSDVKIAMNNVLATAANKGPAVVIDALTLCTTKRLKKEGWTNITVLNHDEAVIKKAKRLGFDGHSGVSTHNLTHLTAEYGVVYLDYCGTPEDTAAGWSPSKDVAHCFEQMAPDGIMVITFSKRCRNAMVKAEKLINKVDGTKLVATYEYCETSPMVSYVILKQEDKTVAERLKTLLPTNKLTIHRTQGQKRSLPTEAPVAKKQKTDMDFVHNIIAIINQNENVKYYCRETCLIPLYERIHGDRKLTSVELESLLQYLERNKGWFDTGYDEIVALINKELMDTMISSGRATFSDMNKMRSNLCKSRSLEKKQYVSAVAIQKNIRRFLDMRTFLLTLLSLQP